MRACGLRALAPIVTFAAMMLGGCNRAPAIEPATMVLRGGTILTMDDAMPDAQALAVRGDRIVAVGTGDEIAAYVDPLPR